MRTWTHLQNYVVLFTAVGKADQTAGLMSSLTPVAESAVDKSAAGAAQLSSSYGIGRCNYRVIYDS